SRCFCALGGENFVQYGLQLGTGTADVGVDISVSEQLCFVLAAGYGLNQTAAGIQAAAQGIAAGRREAVGQIGAEAFTVVPDETQPDQATGSLGAATFQWPGGLAVEIAVIGFRRWSRAVVAVVGDVAAHLVASLLQPADAGKFLRQRPMLTNDP